MPLIVTVGKPYYADGRPWPSPGPQANLDLCRDGCELLLWMPHPSSEEIEAVSSGPCRFGLAVFEHAAIFLHRFDHPDGQRGQWGDLAWSPVVQPDPSLPGERGDGLHLLLVVVLVDSATGIVKALRMVTVSPRMADALHEAIESIRPGDPASYRRGVEKVYARYPSSAMLLRQRAEVTCKGGTAEEFIE